MGANPGRSSSCNDHQWREGKGVCPSCLADRLLALTSAISKADRSRTTSNTASQPLETDRITISDNISSDMSPFFTADASFSWQRSKTQCNSGHFIECFLDAEDNQQLCLVYLNSEIDLNSHSQGKVYKPASDGCHNGNSYFTRPSSVRTDKVATSGKKQRSLWTPSTILKKLLAGTKISTDLCTSHQHKKGEEVGAAGVLTNNAVGDGSDTSMESQRSDVDKIHPPRRVIPATSTGCYDRLTEAMKNVDQSRGRSHHCFSKGFVAEKSSKPPAWCKALRSSPLGIVSKKSLYETDPAVDLDKQFQGVTTSCSRSNTLGEQDRRQHPYISPAHTLFYRDHSHSQ